MVENSLYFFLSLIGAQLPAQSEWELPMAQEPYFRIHNAVFQSDNGISIQDAAGIGFKNVKILKRNTGPVADVVNARDIWFDGLLYNDQAPLLIRVSGSNSKVLRFTNTSYHKTTKKLETAAGATATAVSFQ